MYYSTANSLAGKVDRNRLTCTRNASITELFLEMGIFFPVGKKKERTCVQYLYVFRVLQSSQSRFETSAGRLIDEPAHT
jgi:hypothetical protein